MCKQTGTVSNSANKDRSVLRTCKHNFAWKYTTLLSNYMALLYIQQQVIELPADTNLICCLASETKTEGDFFWIDLVPFAFP